MAYCATKSAVDMLTKCMSLELAPHKIRVTSINPTIIVTGEYTRLINMMPKQNSMKATKIICANQFYCFFSDMGIDLWKDQLESFKANLPLAEFPSTESCSNAIMFLLSDLAEYTTGTVVMVDSGAVVV